MVKKIIFKFRKHMKKIMLEIKNLFAECERSFLKWLSKQKFISECRSRPLCDFIGWHKRRKTNTLGEIIHKLGADKSYEIEFRELWDIEGETKDIFMGAANYKDGDLISLDNDSYSFDWEVSGYSHCNIYDKDDEYVLLTVYLKS